MDYFLQQCINGVTLGAVYGLVAIGYTMVYGIIGMINFAHGEVFMIGAFCALTAFLGLFGWGIVSIPFAFCVVLLFSMFIAGVYGWTIERVAYRPLRHASRLSALISAIGVSIVLQNYVMIFHGTKGKTIQPIIQGQITLWRDKHDVSISYLQLMTIVLTFVLMVGLTWLIRRTSLGRVQRACEQDKLMAALLGINVDRIISLTFIIGAALAAVAGMIVTLQFGLITFSLGFLFGIKAFTAAVLGGIGSLPGAVLGGLVMGLVESLWSGYLTSDYKNVAAFVLLILVLLVRPYGLFGKPEIEKV